MRARTTSATIALLASLALGAVSLVVPAGAASTEASTAGAGADVAAERSAAEFLGLINNLRASRGLPALQVHSGLAASAQSWAQSMASTGVLAHDPGLGGAVSGWTRIGENVGMGPTVSSIWSAFLASPQHFANLTSPDWTHIGVGFVRSGQAMWTTHRFMTAATVAPPPPPPAPAPTAPPATAPPATVPPAPVVTQPAPVVTAPPAPAPTVPVPTVPPAPGPGAGGAGSAGDGSGDDGLGAGDGAAASVAGDPSAEADRVAEVINALQALPV